MYNWVQDHRLYIKVHVALVTSHIGFWRAFFKAQSRLLPLRQLGSAWLGLTPGYSKNRQRGDVSYIKFSSSCNVATKQEIIHTDKNTLVPSHCKHIYFCCLVSHFKMGVNGDWLAFRAAASGHSRNCDFWHVHVGFIFQPPRWTVVWTQRSFWRQAMVTWMWFGRPWVASGGQWAVEWHVPFQADRKSDKLLHSGPSVRVSLCIKGDPLEGHCSIFESLCSERPTNTRGCAVHIKSDSYNCTL